MPAILDGDLLIKAGGAAISGWRRIEVWISVEHYPRHCIITMTDRNPAQLMEVVAPFQSCTVQIGGDLVITGYVDTVEPYYDKGTHHITLGVRGKTEDAADCSVDVDALALPGSRRMVDGQRPAGRLGGAMGHVACAAGKTPS
jgi:prophage tail gpP-like protein